MEKRESYNFGLHIANAQQSIENIFANLFQHLKTKLDVINMTHNKNVSNVPIIKYETELNQIERNEENENIQILRRIRRENLRTKCCMKCDKKFMTFLQLHSHSKIHKYKKLKRMNYLAKNTTFAPYKQTNHFVTKQLLENAIEEEKSYCCSICEMKFTILKDLEMHKKTHMHKKSLFECDQCQKKFKYLSKLKDHKRIQSNRKRLFF